MNQQYLAQSIAFVSSEAVSVIKKAMKEKMRDMTPTGKTRYLYNLRARPDVMTAYALLESANG